MPRRQFIPVRKGDIVRALADEQAPERRGDFRELCRLLGLTLHYEFFEELAALKEAYFRFDPKVSAAAPPSDTDCRDFIDMFALSRASSERKWYARTASLKSCSSAAPTRTSKTPALLLTLQK